MNWLIADAYAQTGGAQPNPIVSILPMILIFAIFYFLMIRPQQKRQKQHRELVAALKKGDQIISSGGIAGTISNVEEDFIELEIAKGTVIKVQRNAVAQVLPKGSI